MDQDSSKYTDDDLEDGELTESDSSYTPLKRPDASKSLKKFASHQQLTATESGPSQMEESVDPDDSVTTDFDRSSDSNSDSDTVIKLASRQHRSPNDLLSKKNKRKRRTILLRSAEPSTATGSSKEQQTKGTRFKKYDIWTASLQEESLTENMRGIDVRSNDDVAKRDRNVESYDYSLKHHLNGENRLKRHLSTSGDELSDPYAGCSGPVYHRKRAKSSGSKDFNRKSVKERLGVCGGGSSRTSSIDDSQDAPRYILDLSTNLESENADVAKDIARKLCEQKDDLLIQIVNVIGKKLPIELFKETQRIEQDGGMMVMNGERRRTPGGVFLFLLKHNDSISKTDKKLIFGEEMRKSNKDRKILQALKRDQKVQQIKMQLNRNDRELALLKSRAELYATDCKSLAMNAATVAACSSSSTSHHLKEETNGTLSNPPPSPVASNSGLENSPDYAINLVRDNQSPEKLNAASPFTITAAAKRNVFDDESLTAYDEDFLDMNCDEMDMF